MGLPWYSLIKSPPVNVGNPALILGQKIPCAEGQLSPYPTATEPLGLEPMLCNKSVIAMKNLCTTMKSSPLAATRENPSQQWKTQCTAKEYNFFFKNDKWIHILCNPRGWLFFTQYNSLEMRDCYMFAPYYYLLLVFVFFLSLIMTK